MIGDPPDSAGGAAETAGSLAELLRGAPFELILSSGFFGFFAHTGVMAALEEAGLQPALLGGSSAGALVAGLWGAGLSAATIRERLFALRRQDFWDPDPTLGLRARGGHAAGGAGDGDDDGGDGGLGLLRGRAFEALLQDALASVGVRDFADCRLPVRVVVYDLAERATRVLSSGPLTPALRASCSVPGLFKPRRVAGRRYVDGGVSDRPGISAATPGARVLYHHLPANSPWRRFTPSQNQPPARPRLHLLHEPTLPRLSPFHLSRGPAAYALAHEMTLRRLAEPIK